MTTDRNEGAGDRRQAETNAVVNTAEDRFDYRSLAFFGRVNASISHELKNVMAIISETAGLLGDLSDLAATGAPVPPDILKSGTESIMEEIQRGFAVIRQMNRFAHSVDTPCAAVDLTNLLDLVVNLAGYLSFSANTAISPCADPKPVVDTCPFILQAVVYQGLVYAYKNTGANVDITLSIAQGDGNAWRVCFTGFSASGFDPFPDPVTRALAASIGVRILFDRAADQLEIEIPRDYQPT